MALTAMANLGGQATSKQREEMERMPESSALISETRVGRGVVKLWQSTVPGTMGNWFERSEAPRVFRLKGSAGSASLVAWSICTKRNAGLKTMSLTAMANLGGQATRSRGVPLAAARSPIRWAARVGTANLRAKILDLREFTQA